MQFMDFNRFDVSTKELVWDNPAACLDRWGIGPPGPVVVIESEITTLTAAADKVIKVESEAPYLVNLELQSSYDADLLETTWWRQAALYHRHRIPVATVLVLLRREASAPGLTGLFEIRLPDGWLTNQYNYRVVRLWQEDPELYMAGGVNLVPLAPLTNVAEDALPGLVQRMADRINAEPEPRAAMLWTATYLLMGLKFSSELASQLLEGVQNMQESTTYQAIVREGRQEGLIEGRQEGLIEGRVTGEQQLLIRQGTKKFGETDAGTLAAIEAIRDIERLEALGERIIDPDVRDWNSLLAAP
jgi:predicted transposase YdaD